MVISAELRWFWPGDCPDRLYSWFHDRDVPAAGGEPGRIDRYFLQAGNSEVGCKLRDVEGTEPDVAEIKGLITRFERTHIELWGKWRWKPPRDASSLLVRKVRWLRLFCLDGLPYDVPLNQEGEPAEGDHPAQSCQVELTKVTVEGADSTWWTLGFEAANDIATAPLVLARALDMLHPTITGGRLLNYPQFLAEFEEAGSAVSF